MARRNHVDAEEPRKIYRGSPQARVAGLEEGRRTRYVTFVVIYDIYVINIIGDSATQHYRWAGRKAVSAAISSGRPSEAAPMEIGGRLFGFLHHQGLVDKDGIVCFMMHVSWFLTYLSYFSGVSQHQRLQLKFVPHGSRGGDGHRVLAG